MFKIVIYFKTSRIGNIFQSFRILRIHILCFIVELISALLVHLFSLEICFFPLQPCTEVLFIDIFHEYNQTLTPVLLEMMQTLQGKVYFMLL